MKKVATTNELEILKPELNKLRLIKRVINRIIARTPFKCYDLYY